MGGLIRFLALGLVALTIVYVSLLFYARAARRDKLEALWEHEGRPGDRALYVRRGMVEYERTLKRRLVIGVYGVPLCVFVVYVYLTNFA